LDLAYIIGKEVLNCFRFLQLDELGHGIFYELF